MTEPLRVRLNQERHAATLARELSAFRRLDLQRSNGTWEVTVFGSLGDRDVVHVLNAVRQALDGDSSARALVLLNGREYELQAD